MYGVTNLRLDNCFQESPTALFVTPRLIIILVSMVNLHICVFQFLSNELKITSLMTNKECNKILKVVK